MGNYEELVLERRVSELEADVLRLTEYNRGMYSDLLDAEQRVRVAGRRWWHFPVVWYRSLCRELGI